MEYQISDLLSEDISYYQDNFEFQHYEAINKTRYAEEILAQDTSQKVDILIDKIKQRL